MQWWLGESDSAAWCRPCLVTVSSISCHYRWYYLITNTGVVLLILTKYPTTQSEPKYWIFLSKSLYIQNTPQLFQLYLFQLEISRWACSTVTSVNSQQKKYQVNNPKGKKYFTYIVDGLEVTFLGAEIRYQPRWWIRESGSVACCRQCCYCLVPLSSMSCHDRCHFLVTTTDVVVSILNKLPTTHIKPKDWIFLSKSLYIQNTTQLFSTVSSPIGYQ